MVAIAMQESFDELKARIVNCTKCHTMNKGQRRVLGVGVHKPAVFFLGEAPGRLGADRTGVPFTKDKSGRLLREMMQRIGLSVERNAYISNIVKCNPRSIHGVNRKPSMTEISNCRDFLEAELKLVNPKVVVPLGLLASKQILELSLPMSMYNTREFHNDGLLIFPLYHPGVVVRGIYSLDAYYQNFCQLKELLAKTFS